MTASIPVRFALIASCLAGRSGLSQPVQPATSTSTSTAPACDTDAHRAFDFLVGTWNVHARSPEDGSAGTVVVSKLLGDCAIEEVWTSPSGRTGRSVNLYSPTDGQWHQTYADTSGTVLVLAGGIDGGAMVLLDASDPGSRGPRSRFSWRPLEDGSVLQKWERSERGDEWTVEFEATWTRAEDAPPSEALLPFEGLLGVWEVTPIQQDPAGAWKERATTRARVEVILEGKFIREEAVLDLPVGRVAYVLLLGYDPFQEVYRLSWNDSLAGLADIYEGSVDEDGSVLTVDNLESKTLWKTPDGARWAFRLEYELKPHNGERRARVFASDDDGTTWALFQTTVYRSAAP